MRGRSTYTGPGAVAAALLAAAGHDHGPAVESAPAVTVADMPRVPPPPVPVQTEGSAPRKTGTVVLGAWNHLDKDLD